MKPLPAPVEAAFERFFAAYPKRPGGNPKAPAREIFARRVREEKLDPEALVRAIAAQAASWRVEQIDPKFIPHARTWLSQRRYDDFLAVPAGPASPLSVDMAHPLAWLRGEIGADAYASWIAALRVVPGDGTTLIIAPTGLVRDRVRQSWGAIIRQRVGPVTFVRAGEEPTSPTCSSHACRS